MFNIKEGTKFNITYFAKKYGKFITRAGVWTEQSKQWISKKNESLFTYYDLDNEGYRTASGDFMLWKRKDN
jgi:two-component SAPR family response regulator